MTESERIKYALVNVSVIAKNSEFYNEYRDIYDIELIESIVKKEIPQTPPRYGDGYDHDGELIIDTWECPRCGEVYEIGYHDYEYCPKCGQHIDRSEIKEILGETE